jgi:hypothetical protein
MDQVHKIILQQMNKTVQEHTVLAINFDTDDRVQKVQGIEKKERLIMQV